jgi:hypothetical protein
MRVTNGIPLGSSLSLTGLHGNFRRNTEGAVQTLLANGVALLSINPYIHDGYDYFSNTDPSATAQQVRCPF